MIKKSAFLLSGLFCILLVSCSAQPQKPAELGPNECYEKAHCPPGYYCTSITLNCKGPEPCVGECEKEE